MFWVCSRDLTWITAFSPHVYLPHVALTYFTGGKKGFLIDGINLPSSGLYWIPSFCFQNVLALLTYLVGDSYMVIVPFGDFYRAVISWPYLVSLSNSCVSGIALPRNLLLPEELSGWSSTHSSEALSSTGLGSALVLGFCSSPWLPLILSF